MNLVGSPYFRAAVFAASASASPWPIAGTPSDLVNAQPAGDIKNIDDLQDQSNNLRGSKELKVFATLSTGLKSFSAANSTSATSCLCETIAPPGVLVTNADWTHWTKRPIGTYFSFDLSEWASIFGDLTTGSVFEVQQWRGGELVWTGNIKVWPRGGSKDRGALADSPRGRTEPWTKTIVQTVFKTGDYISTAIAAATTTANDSCPCETIAPTGVLVTNADWTHWTKRPIGTYFSFELLEWARIFGDLTPGGSVFEVEQWRGGELVWTGNVKVWPSGGSDDKSDMADSPRGRTEPWTENNVQTVFRTGDHISTAIAAATTTDDSCPCETIAPPGVLVTNADWRHWTKRPTGTYFSFELWEWARFFEDPTAGGSVFEVEQWRGGALVWTGDIKVWPSGGSNDQSDLVDLPRGRTEPWTKTVVHTVFKTGDRISPVSQQHKRTMVMGRSDLVDLAVSR